MNDSSTEKSVVDILFELQLIEEGEDPIQNLRDTIKEIRIVAHDLINKNYFRPEISALAESIYKRAGFQLDKLDIAAIGKISEDIEQTKLAAKFINLSKDAQVEVSRTDNAAATVEDITGWLALGTKAVEAFRKLALFWGPSKENGETET